MVVLFTFRYSGVIPVADKALVSTWADICRECFHSDKGSSLRSERGGARLVNVQVCVDYLQEGKRYEVQEPVS